MADVDDKPVVPAAGKFDPHVEAWFAESFSDTALSRSTECWNLVREKLDDLKKRLAQAS